MPTNLLIDDELLEEAKQLGGFKTKRQTVNEALREFIDQKKRSEILSLRGQVDFFVDYDYKKLRRKR